MYLDESAIDTHTILNENTTAHYVTLSRLTFHLVAYNIPLTGRYNAVLYACLVHQYDSTKLYAYNMQSREDKNGKMIKQ